jgi:hypothetical protein
MGLVDIYEKNKPITAQADFKGGDPTAVSGLEQLYKKEKPITAKADTKGGDKTLIEGDGGLDLSKDEKALKKARYGEIGQGTPRGYNPKTNYSSIARD